MGSQTRYFFEENEGDIGEEESLFEDGQDWHGSLGASRRTNLNVQVMLLLYLTTLNSSAERTHFALKISFPSRAAHE